MSRKSGWNCNDFNTVKLITKQLLLEIIDPYSEESQSINFSPFSGTFLSTLNSKSIHAYFTPKRGINLVQVWSVSVE